MSSNAFNYLALLAALVVGYGIFVSTGDESTATADATGMLQGYFLRDAIITETGVLGLPQFRVAAAEVAQNLQNDSVVLASLRVDYLEHAVEQSAENATPAHWVLNADRGTAFENFRRLELRDNVRAHNLGAARALVLDAPSLDVDMVNEIATSQDAVQIGIDDSTVSGRELFADLHREQFRLEADVGLRLAQVKPTASDTPAIQVPDSFEAKSTAFDGNVLTMIEVASKSPPFIKAQQLRSAGRDIANNKIELKGNVTVELPKSGSLAADKAIVVLRNRAVAQAHAEADSPDKFVEFEHRAKDSDKLIRGRASTVDYDVEQAALHLEGKVWLSDAHGEWTFDQLDYNITTEAWRGTNTKGSLNRPPKGASAPPTDKP
jgi:LPS export ABC transporter protein LptC